MSVLHRSIELLEPYDGKLSCTVLRGESARKGADLPDPREKWICLVECWIRGVMLMYCDLKIR